MTEKEITAEIAQAVEDEVEEAIEEVQQHYDLSTDEEEILQKFLTELFTAGKTIEGFDRDDIDAVIKDFETEYGALTDNLIAIFGDYRNCYPVYLEKLNAE